jgi:hypothetical protein
MVAVLEEGSPGFEVAAWLIDQRRRLDMDEAVWLDVLAEFDRDQAWAVDGHLTCADWLRWTLKLCRSTAYEKLRVAHELRRRPLVKAAFAAGEITYSAARAITRLDDVTEAVDRALVALAINGTVLDLERAIRFYELHHQQDQPPDPRGGRDQRRDVRSWYGPNEMGTTDIDLTNLETKEFATALEAFASDPVTSRGDISTDPVPWTERRADAFMAMVRTALAHAHDGHAVGADRYQVHVVVDTATGLGRAMDGTPLAPATVAAVCCDASTVLHVVRDGEPLALGRKSRVWSTAQRRAIVVRDHGHCRFPGCQRTFGDAHHIRWWEHQGPTNVDNGMYLCNRHHTMIHRRMINAYGNGNHDVTFTRDDGTHIGTTRPPGPELRLL